MRKPLRISDLIFSSSFTLISIQLQIVPVKNRQSHNIVLIANMTLPVFFWWGEGGGLESLYCILLSYRRSLCNLRNDSRILEQATDGEYLSL